MIILESQFNSIVKETIEDIKDLVGLSLDYMESIKISKNLTNALGMCTRERLRFKITISFLALHLGKQELKNIIAHELIHTIDNCFNHDSEFIHKCTLINDNIKGYEVKAIYPKTSKINFQELRKVTAKYVIKCNSCSKEYYKYKRVGVVKKPYNYRCGCGGTLDLV